MEIKQKFKNEQESGACRRFVGTSCLWTINYNHRRAIHTKGEYSPTPQPTSLETFERDLGQSPFLHFVYIGLNGKQAVRVYKVKVNFV